MKIKAIFENDKGQHELNAVLSNAQLKFLIEFALLEIMRKGLMVPMINDDAITLVEFGKTDKQIEEIENEQTPNHS